ncbi:MAG: ATP-binding protein [Melioribacteraceae bacterium]|nr:ATP-binding protein [Melioribacteraceae bacterium]
MNRYLYKHVIKDLKKKMVFITGPRQVGKTFFSKQIMLEFKNPQYFNFDNVEDKLIIQQMIWRKDSDLLVFDEIHKKKDWKNFIKGVFDSKNINQSILVTGSARLDTFRQVGDSLAGRYYHYHLNPFSIKELKTTLSNYERLEQINNYGGFPEPLIQSLEIPIEEAEIELKRWQNQYYTDLIREDIFEFSKLREINSMKTLLELLRSRVGSPLSYSALANLLELSVNTVKKYIEILQSLYIVFLVRPYHKNVARSILKEPKIYFYDTSYIKGDEGIKLENTVAISLLKHSQFLYDSKGEKIELNYIRTKEGKEIDFCLTKNDAPLNFIEVKLSDKNISRNLKYFIEKFPNVKGIQLVHNLHQERDESGISVLRASDWLMEISA